MFSLHKLIVSSLAIVFLGACHAAGHAQDPPSVPDGAAAESGAKWALIICGIPGDEEHHTLYSESIESLHDSLTERLGFPASNIHIQFGTEPTEEDGPAVTAAQGKATRSELAAEVEGLRKVLQPADALWVFVLGHAHYDGRNSYLNLPGAGEGDLDLHEDDFAILFQDIPAAQQVFFITTSVSGFFTRPLSAKGRVIITATEADREVNETLFHAALTETLAEPPEKEKFDVDGDDQITLFDLYICVAQNVARRYAAEMLLATEHAQLDDNGDRRGTELQLDYLTEEEGGRAKDGAEPPKIRQNSDGYLAQQIALPIELPEPAPAEPAPAEPAATAPVPVEPAPAEPAKDATQ